MSLTLQGYDLFSIGQFQAALEALLPAAAQQAGLAPAILASVRTLGFGQEHEAMASLVLKDALAVAPSAQGESIQLAQAEEVICDGDAALAGDCMMQIVPGSIPPGGVPSLQNDGRGVENYSG
jgi:hypothetical protein